MGESNETQNDNDDKAAAAKARRQRILENSNKRLSKITGRVHNEETPELESTTLGSNGNFYPDPDYERDVFQSAPPQFASLMSHENQDPLSFFRAMQQDGQQQNFFNPMMSSTTSSTPPKPKTKFQKLIDSKIPIISLALITYSLFAFELDALIGGVVFSTLIAWEIFEFGYSTFIVREVEQLGIINVVFAFVGITAEKGRLILKFLSLFNKIIRDIAIFMFTFVSIHILWSRFIMGESFTQILDKDMHNLLSKDEL